MTNISQYPYLKADMLDFPFKKKQRIKVPNVTEQGELHSMINARSALEFGIRCLGLCKGDEILLPAYHCPVMVYPIVNSGLTPIFYKILPDCSADIDDIRSKVTSQTKAVIAVHYFGFPNNISQIGDFCRCRNIYLIEDCAHSFWGKIDQSAIGSFGDIAIASIWKFFPVLHGGFLIINNGELLNKSIYYRQAPLAFQIKAALNIIDYSRDTGMNFKLLSPLLQIKEKLWSKIKSIKNETNESKNSPNINKKENPYDFEKLKGSYVNWKIPWFGGWIFNWSDQNKIVERRLSNYSILHRALDKIKGVTPLFKMPPPGIVPYNFPIIVDDADELVNKLRKKHINISRFGNIPWLGMSKDVCEVSSYYSTSCIQLPIHQSLTEKDIHQMICKVKMCR